MRNFRPRSAGLWALVVSMLVLTAGAPAPAQERSGAPEPPRLLVLLVLDQFSYDYIDLYGHQWTQGLRRLLDEGALFTKAAYPYGRTATCAGHGTIGTGAFPQRHGLVGNQWYDRELDKRVTCEEDASVEPIVIGDGEATARHSARYLQVPALADELRRQASLPPAIVSVAEKPRSAIALGGHGGPGTVVLWKTNSRVWSTSTAYSPVPWTDASDFVERNPITRDYGTVWTKLLPESAYQFVDDDPSEPEPAPWGRTFPKVLEGPDGPQDGIFATAWERSPWADAFVVDLALHLRRTRQLGEHDGTDMLAIGLGALDQLGHRFGPRSHEVQDLLARADVTIGRLLETLDREVGPGRYVLGWSADHGVTRIPEQVLAEGGEAGRLGSISALATGLLRWALGPGDHVGLGDGPELALTPAARERLRAQPEVKALLMSALAASPGVARVFDREMLSATDATDDPDLKAWRLSYVPDRSGDFIVVLKPGWIYDALPANHGTQNWSDQHVPVGLFGAGVRRGHFDDAATPADLAPTLASLAGIELPSAQGRVLREALAP